MNKLIVGSNTWTKAMVWIARIPHASDLTWQRFILIDSIKVFR